MNQVSSDIPLAPGQLFAGRYRIERLLGAGGYAYIFLAMQEDLERQVAIKVMRPELFVGKDDAEQQSRFKRFAHEGKLLSRLRDARTITMYDYGQIEGVAYMVFEYIIGVNLTDLMRRDGPLEPRRAVRILKQVLLSLREAHALGVLHRDIKPDNIMVWSDLHGKEQVKVLDFGIAKIAGDEHALTQVGKTVGTPRYMAPERIQKIETEAADLYSLGLVAWELLVGRQVLDGLGSMQLVAWQTAAPSLKLPEDLQVPGALREIVDRLLAKPLTERWRTVTDVLLALEHWSEPALPRWEIAGREVDEESGLLSLELATKAPAPAPNRTESMPDTMQLRRRRSAAEPVLPEPSQAPGAGHTVQMALGGEDAHDEPAPAAAAVVPPAAAPAAQPSLSAQRRMRQRQRQRLMMVGLVTAIIGALALLALFIGYIIWRTQMS
jgi:serine/threonine-protein kinase